MHLLLEFAINNNGDFGTGRFYAPDALIHWNPNGKSVNETQIIADSIIINNNDDFRILYGEDIVPGPEEGPESYVLLIE